MKNITRFSLAALVVAATLGTGCSKRDDTTSPPGGTTTAPSGAMAPASSASQ